MARPLPPPFETLLASVYDTKGDLSIPQRDGIRRFVAARSGGPDDAPQGLPKSWQALLVKIADAPYRVVDEDLDALRDAGLSEGAIFDLVLSASVAAGEARLRRVHALLDAQEP